MKASVYYTAEVNIGAMPRLKDDKLWQDIVLTEYLRI